MIDETCSALAHSLGEPARGTAPVTTGWLLIEHPGPWYPRGLEDSPFPGEREDVHRRLAAETDRIGIRPQLIRRHDRTPDAAGRVTAFLVHAGTDIRWAERLTLDRAGDLTTLDLEVLASAEAPGIGESWSEPLLLVCTHGKRDACCARLGRPVAMALEDHDDGAWRRLVWETTHTGGHRFAGNLVALPEALVYGYLDEERAVGVTATHLSGEVDLAHLRGRASLDRWQQAAEWYARERTGWLDLAGVSIGGTEMGTSERQAAVEVRVGARTVRVALAREPLGTPRLMGCTKDEPEDPGQIVLTGLTRIS